MKLEQRTSHITQCINYSKGSIQCAMYLITRARTLNQVVVVVVEISLNNQSAYKLYIA